MNDFYIKLWEKKLQEESIASDIFGYNPVYPHLKTIWERFVWWFVWKIHAGQRHRAETEWSQQEFALMDNREAIPMNVIVK